MYCTLQFLKIDDLYEFELYKFIHQFHHGKLSKVFCNSFTKIASVHAHNTRFKQSAIYVLAGVSKSSFAKTNFLIEGPIYGVNWIVTIKAYFGLLAKSNLKNIFWIAIDISS